MKILSDIPFELNIEILKEKLHIKSGSCYEQCMEDIISTAYKVANPKVVFKESSVGSRKNDSVIIGSVEFISKTLRKNLEKVERVFPYVATCGVELDNVKINRDDLLEQYILETVKEILLQESMGYLERYICKRYGVKTASMNPGSSDLFAWAIEQQKELFSLFPDISKAIGVKLTENYFMIPNKSISGIRFPADTGFHNCRVCDRKRCPSRVKPFNEALLKSTLESMNI
jgi:hypothetical protein